MSLTHATYPRLFDQFEVSRSGRMENPCRVLHRRCPTLLQALHLAVTEGQRMPNFCIQTPIVLYPIEHGHLLFNKLTRNRVCRLSMQTEDLEADDDLNCV